MVARESGFAPARAGRSIFRRNEFGGFHFGRGKRVSKIIGIRLETKMILIIDIAFPADKLDE